MKRLLWIIPAVLGSFSLILIFSPQWLSVVPADVLWYLMLGVISVALIALLAHAFRVAPIATLYAVVACAGINLVVVMIRDPLFILQLNNGTPVLSYSMAFIALLGAGIFAYSLFRRPRNRSRNH